MSIVSVRSRVRKSKRAIDPEFDTCQETLVGFVDNHNQPPPKKSGNYPKQQNVGPSLLLTPVPTAVQMKSSRSLSRGNMAPAKRRNLSIGGPPNGLSMSDHATTHARKQSTTSLSDIANGESYQRGVSDGGCRRRMSSTGMSSSDNENGMVDVSLEDEKAEEEGSFVGAYNKHGNGGLGTNASQQHSSCPLNVSQHSHPLISNKPGLPPQPMIPSHQRYSSPLPVYRTSSGLSANGGGSVISHAQSDVLSSSVRSQSSRSARSRSRSRSRRRMGGHLRMRSLGAASAFAAASPSSAEEDLQNNLHGEAANLEPISIPLKDIVSVDEEVPSRTGGSNAGSGGDFYSSAASDVGAAKEKAKESGQNGKAALPPHLSSPTPPTTGNGKVLYRIFLHTLSHGYVEFSLENSNSHDIFMAYLKAHLAPDRIPNRDAPNNAKQIGGALLRTMVLTPTKELPESLSSSTRTANTQSTNPAANRNTSNAVDFAQPPPAPSLPRPDLLTRSNSTISCNIDKLHSKVIKQRLQNESTPMQRMKDNFAGLMSRMLDCACCQDTTVAPLGSAGSIQGTPDSKLHGGYHRVNNGGSTPNSTRLRDKGIGGLSFEIESCGGTPKLSFEPSVGGESVKRYR